MQTFLPYADFAKSAAVLDMKRLGKQRVETLQVMKALVGQGGLSGGWTRHPASRLWDGHLNWLMQYQVAVCHEWHVVRGYHDTCYEKTVDLYMTFAQDTQKSSTQPWFIDNDDFHLSHQSNLVRKAPELYIPHLGPIRADLHYIWRQGEVLRTFEEVPV